jgi:serine protease inhibitor
MIMILRQWFTAAIIFALFPLLSGCDLFVSGHEDTGEQDPFERRELPRQLSVEEMQIVDGSGAFGFNMMHKLLERDPDASHFISPLSILMAYGMTMNGADSDTYTQMQKVFGLDGMSREEINQAARELIDLLVEYDEDVRFNIANSIWYRVGYPVTAEFLETNQTYFDAVIEEVDFNDPETIERINQWVSDKTDGLIDEIIETIPPNIVMYLINAIYFNGEWTYPFDPEKTETKPFTRTDNTTVDVEMMRMDEGDDMLLAQGEDYTAVNLYYGDAGYAMTLVLPDEETGLENWLSSMTWNDWQELTDGFTETRFNLELPKFELEYEVDGFQEILEEMGIVDAFGPADFSRITGGPNDLFIGETRHKTFIAVDEEGTEAAAVTSVGIYESATPEIRFNRPFFYTIREAETGTILFMGTMTMDGETEKPNN